MKLFKIALVVLLFLVNLVVAEPSFAEKKYTENPDYIIRESIQHQLMIKYI